MNKQEENLGIWSIHTFDYQTTPDIEVSICNDWDIVWTKNQTEVQILLNDPDFDDNTMSVVYGSDLGPVGIKETISLDPLIYQYPLTKEQLIEIKQTHCGEGI